MSLGEKYHLSSAERFDGIGMIRTAFKLTQNRKTLRLFARGIVVDFERHIHVLSIRQLQFVDFRLVRAAAAEMDAHVKLADLGD